MLFVTMTFKCQLLGKFGSTGLWFSDNCLVGKVDTSLPASESTPHKQFRLPNLHVFAIMTVSPLVQNRTMCRLWLAACNCGFSMSVTCKVLALSFFKTVFTLSPNHLPQSQHNNASPTKIQFPNLHVLDHNGKAEQCELPV